MGLWSACWFGMHGDRVRERDASGAAVLACPDCRHAIPILSDADMLRGPKHSPDPVLGQPTGKARPERFTVARRSA